MERGSARVLVGPDAKFLDLFVRVTGSWYQNVFGFFSSRAIPKSRP